MEKLGICCDHAGYHLKQELKSYLEEKDLTVVDFGTDSPESCDYPDYAHPLAFAVEKGDVPRGISICGSGNGINMTVNKHQGIRSALCWNEEISYLGRYHNDANICSIPSRFVTFEEAKKIVDAFLNTRFEGGRHVRRIKKIPIK